MAGPEGLDEGMAALLAARAAALSEGAGDVGWKVGLNGPAVQALFGLDSLVVGSLTDRTVFPDGAAIDVAGWAQPALEVEVALRVGPDGGIAAVAPALELVDLNLPFDRLEPILAANIFHRGVIFGPEQAPASATGLAVCVTAVGSDEERAAAALDDDLAVTLEATRRFLARFGVDLEPGQRVIAGSLIAPLALTAGDAVSVDFGALGTLGLSLTNA